MNKNELSEKLRNLMKRMRRPTLYCELDKSKFENGVTNKSYFGSLPFNVESIDENKVFCSECQTHMNFIFQFYVPKNNLGERVNNLYQIFLCISCSINHYRTNYYIRKLKTESKEINVIETNENIRFLEKIKWVTKHDINVLPAYDFPELDYANETYPEIIEKLDEISGGRAFEAYLNYIEKVNEGYGKTGVKYKGNTELIFLKDVPRNSNGEMMPLLFSVDVEYELGVNFGGENSVLLIFESEETNEVVCRITRIEEGEAITY